MMELTLANGVRSEFCSAKAYIYVYLGYKVDGCGKSRRQGSLDNRDGSS